MFLTYTAGDGSRALIDRELYLPQKWTQDRDRCQAAGIGDEVGFATKPQLAWRMIERAVTAGVPFAWVAGDEVYGQNPGLRAALEQEQISYVTAVHCSEPVTVPVGERRADELAALVPEDAWQRLSCAGGSKGPRLYDWALIETVGSDHRLLVRRSLHPGEKGQLELAFLLVLRAARRGPGRAGDRSRRALGSRGLLRRGRERDRPGPVPGPQVPHLVPAHHPGHAGPRVPRRHRARGGAGRRREARKKGTCPLWTTFRSTEDIRLSGIHNRRNRARPHPAHRRLFNLHTRVIRPGEFHEHWSGWRRRRQASARKSRYTRRTWSHSSLLWY